jgi:hypothetical protein
LKPLLVLFDQFIACLKAVKISWTAWASPMTSIVEKAFLMSSSGPGAECIPDARMTVWNGFKAINSLSFYTSTLSVLNALTVVCGIRVRLASDQSASGQAFW